jgi:glycosyltransferase involved in cell wall biosynthesis
MAGVPGGIRLTVMMRVFHFANAALGVEELSSGGKGVRSGGGWTAALVGRMLAETDHVFGYAAFGEVNQVQHIRRERIDYFIVPKQLGKAGLNCKKALSVCGDIVNAWEPDLVHIHGTEGPFGLLTARSIIKCPAIISLQGLLGPCAEWYRFFGNRSLLEIVQMHRWLEVLRLRGQWSGFLQIRKNAKREKEIIGGNRFFMGRTAWDRAYIHELTPTSMYYHEGRFLREPFWQRTWSLETAKRHRLLFTNAKHPRKGTEVLIDAVRILRPDYPDIHVCLAGGIPHRTGYGRHLRRKMLEVGNCVTELGALNAEQLTGELIKTHVFVHPSFIDNSPNSVAEAQLLGMPVVATYTGGVPSLIEDGRTGLFSPTGDAFMLAARIREIFEDDDLAVRLGSQAREVAVRRHDPDVIVNEILAVYEDVLRRSNVLQQKPIPVPA